MDLHAIPYCVEVCAALVFAWAAAGKLRGQAVFEGILANYRLLPRPLVRPAALILPLVEGATALALLAPPTAVSGCVAGMVLLGVFAGAMAINLGRGRSEIDCGCGDPKSRQKLSAALVARNLVMALGLGLAALWSTTSPSLGDAVTGAAAGLIGFFLYLSQEAMAAWPKAKGRPRAHRRAMLAPGGGQGARP